MAKRSSVRMRRTLMFRFLSRRLISVTNLPYLRFCEVTSNNIPLISVAAKPMQVAKMPMFTATPCHRTPAQLVSEQRPTKPYALNKLTIMVRKPPIAKSALANKYFLAKCDVRYFFIEAILTVWSLNKRTPGGFLSISALVCNSAVRWYTLKNSLMLMYDKMRDLGFECDGAKV